jgi:cytochrome b subunit of formate dehydrogenase
MPIKSISSLVILIALLAVMMVVVHETKTILFVDDYVILVLSAALGLFAGILGILLKRPKKLPDQETIEKRHTLGSFLQHWGSALGIFVLIISGFETKADPSLFSSNLHFSGLLFTLLFGCYFLADFIGLKKYQELLPDVKDIVDGTIRKYIFRKKWTDTGKYKASQKSGFLAFAVLGGEVLLSGIIKTLALRTNINSDLLNTATLVHDVSGQLLVLLTVVHIILAFSSRTNIRLLASWFTGGKFTN